MVPSGDRQLSGQTEWIDAWFGERLKLRRRMLGLTQDQLAKEAGLSPQQIHKYEAGHSKMTASRMVQFSILLDVSVAWFFDGVPDFATEAAGGGFEPITEDELRLIKRFRSIEDPRQRQRLLEITLLFASND